MFGGTGGASRYISVGFLPQSFVFTRLVTSWLLWPYLSALCIDSAGLYGALQGFTQKEAESMSILLHRLSRNGLQRSDPRTIAYESSTRIRLRQPISGGLRRMLPSQRHNGQVLKAIHQ